MGFVLSNNMVHITGFILYNIVSIQFLMGQCISKQVIEAIMRPSHTNNDFLQILHFSLYLLTGGFGVLSDSISSCFPHTIRTWRLCNTNAKLWTHATDFFRIKKWKPFCKAFARRFWMKKDYSHVNVLCLHVACCPHVLFLYTCKIANNMLFYICTKIFVYIILLTNSYRK